MMSASIEQRVKLVQGELSNLVAMHESGTFPEGPEALNAKISNILTENKLWEMRTVQVDNVGVFPCNRGCGLVSFDVHGLLFETFYQNGYNPEKWDCCAITVLDEWKQSWLEFNQKLHADSDGLLPPISDLELATGRGSHGVASLRACKFPTVSAHAEIAGAGGYVSMNLIVNKQPSMKAPLENGVRIKVLHAEVERAVPGLFTVISRIGNVTNSHYRLQTTLQSCKRIHSIAAPMMEVGIDWEKVARIACIGMHPKESENIGKLCAFVQRWSGGKNGEFLNDLERYEKTLHFRRSILASDLQQLSECDLPEYERIILAILT